MIIVIDDLLDDFSTEQAVAHYFDDTHDVTDALEHLIIREEKDKREHHNFWPSTSHFHHKEIVQDLFPKMTYNLWLNKSLEEMLHKTNSE